jgi:hypothetical protein
MGIKTRITEAGLVSTNVPGELSSFDCLVPLASEGDLGTFLRTIRTVTPTGTSADAANIQAALTAMAGIGEVRLKAGTYVITSTLSVPKKTRLYGVPGKTILNSTMTPSGDVNQAITSALAGVAMLGTTTVNGSNTRGASTVTAASTAGGALPVGTASYYRANPTDVRIRDNVSGSGFQGSLYRVISVSGAGPYTVTLDRPVWWQWGAGDALEVMGNVNEDVHIAGITYTGTSTRLLEHIGVRRHLIEECRFVADEGWATDIVASFDTNGYDNEFRKCEFFGDNTATADCVLALETQENSRITDCRVRGGVYNGIVLFDCVGCVVTDTTVHDCGNYGLGITGDGNTIGSLATKIVRGRYNSNDVGGITVANGSTDTRFTDVEARYNPTNVLVGDPGSTVTGTVISGRFDNGSTYGIGLNATARGTVANDVDVSACGIGVSVGNGADIVINGIRCTGSITTSAIVSAGYTVVHGAWIAPSSAINVIDVSANRLDLMSGYLSGGNGSNLVRCSAGVAHVGLGMRLAVAGGGIGVYTHGGVARVDVGTDLSGCAKPAARDTGTIHSNTQFTFGATGAFGASTTAYPGLGGVVQQTTAAKAKVRIERTMTVRKMRIDAATAPGVGKTTTVTLQKNEVDTAIVVTLTGTNTTAEIEAASGADYFSNFAVGDYLSIKVATDAGNAMADIHVSVGAV